MKEIALTSDGLIPVINNLHNLSEDISGMIIDFLNNVDLSKLDDISSIIDLYPLLLENLPNNVKKPTLDEYQYVAAMYETQKHVDWLRLRINRLKQELYEMEQDLSPSEDKLNAMKKLEKHILKLHSELRTDLDSIKKYSTAGMNRVSTRKIDVNVNNTLNIQQFNEALKTGARELHKLGTDSNIYSDVIDVPDEDIIIKDTTPEEQQIDSNIKI